jgi:hypothetical protein
MQKATRQTEVVEFIHASLFAPLIASAASQLDGSPCAVQT